MGLSGKRSYTEYCSDLERHQSALNYPSPTSATTITSTTPASNSSHSTQSQTRSSPAERCVINWLYEQRSKAGEPKDHLETSWKRDELPLPRLRRSASLPGLHKLRSLPRVAPLTQENLLSAGYEEGGMDSTLVNGPATPAKSVASISLKCDTPSQASNVSGSTDVDAKLKLIKIFGDEISRPLLDEMVDFKAKVHSIVNIERLSAMKPQSTKKLRRDFNDVKSRNEATLHDRTMPHLIKSERIVSAGENADDIYREFREDGLERNVDADFSSGSVPIPPSNRSQGDFDRFGVKNPKPDFTFGFSPSIFTTEELLLLRHYDNSYSLSKGIISPFFIMEWKGCRGTMEDCSVQARRGGAAIVNARRQIHASTIPQYNYSDPDLATIAFSCAMTSEIAYIAVHWCQRVEDSDCWYMAVVKRFFLAENEHLQNLRTCLHNIIDWGLLERQRSVKEELKVLNEEWQRMKAQALTTQEQSSSFKRRRKQ